MLAILLIPAGLCYTFGRMIGDTREGRALLAAMTIVFVALLPITYIAEQSGNPVLTRLGADQVSSATNPGGNMEGKEVRFGIANPVLALAGAFARAKNVPASAGTLPTHTPLFVVVLISTVITVGALTFVPALALGPVIEHLLLYTGN